MKKFDDFAWRVQFAMGGWLAVCTVGALVSM